jgi:glycosyltransferase involved in cell wall biosynthesis
VRVTLAIMGAGLDERQREACLSAGIELEQGAYRLEWMRDPWQDVARAGEWLLALERRHSPDVVHLNGYCHAALAFRASTLVVAHSCVCSWWRAVRSEAAPAEYDRYRSEVRAGLLSARTVVAPTLAMLRSIVSEYGQLPRCRVIYNGAAPAPAQSLRKEPIVLTAGRSWDAAKNIQALDEAARELPWPCYVAGQERGPEGQIAPPFQRVVSLGTLSKKALMRWMARASIFAAPALYEPFGLAILEAANAGCALVLADILSLRELWDRVAVFVDPRDTRALAAQISRLIARPLEIARLGARARRRARELSIEQCGARYLALYEADASRRNPARKVEARA